MPVRLILAASLLLVLVVCGSAPARVLSSDPTSAPAGRVIVELEAAPPLPAERADRALLRDRVGDDVQAVVSELPPAVRVERSFDGLPMFVATVDEAGLAALAAHPGVRSITPDFTLEFQLDESTRVMRADEVRAALGASGAGVTVAVIDSGIDTDHPDLVGDIAFQECYMIGGGCPGGGTHTSGPGSAEDEFGHGTQVAGDITSTGTVAGPGIAPDADVGMYKIAGASGALNFSDVLSSLNDIIANHPEVRAVNLSIGNGTNHGASCDALFPPMTTAVNTLLAANTLVFVSSGNDGFATGLAFPACISNAIAVGGTWDDSGTGPIGVAACSETPAFDRPMCMSNSATSLDVLAPGGQITTTAMGGGSVTSSGTSQAAPHAVAAAAVLWSLDGSLTAAQVESALEANGVPRTDPKNAVITPRIDLWKASASLVADPDGDGLAGPIDNCPFDANAAQTNTDRNFVDNSPPYAVSVDDKTWANSDNIGDACDPDDDSDGRTDADEASGAGCAGIVSNALLRDTDGDRFLDGPECALAFDPGTATSKPALVACAPSGDPDGDKIQSRIEVCFYGSSPNVAETDADGSVDGAKDGCEIASLNGDRIVSSIDQGMLAQGISGSAGYTVNVDINKDGVLSSIDQGIMASFIVPAGQCP